MPRRQTFDSADVDALLGRNDGIATHTDLLGVGVPRRTTAHRARNGPWQRVLPGVVAGHRGPLGRRELRTAALAYCGPNAVISGEHALDLHGITGSRITIVDQILVLIPWEQKRLSSGFVTVERTRRMPDVTHRRGLPVVPPARAAADAARHGADLNRIREIFGATLHQKRATLEQLRVEVYDGPNQRSGDARNVLGEVAVGVRSAAEAEVLRLVSKSRLPQPEWNVPVVVGGRLVGEADAYWEELGVALEVDGIRWHSTPEAIRRTQAKQRRYAEARGSPAVDRARRRPRRPRGLPAAAGGDPGDRARASELRNVDSPVTIIVTGESTFPPAAASSCLRRRGSP